MLKDAVIENGDEGLETGNAGTDDSHVGLQSGPDTGVNETPFKRYMSAFDVRRDLKQTYR